MSARTANSAHPLQKRNDTLLRGVPFLSFGTKYYTPHEASKKLNSKDKEMFDNQTECTICMNNLVHPLSDNFTTSDDLDTDEENSTYQSAAVERLDTCGHMFHHHCLKLLCTSQLRAEEARKLSCPLCREPLSEKWTKFELVSRLPFEFRNLSYQFRNDMDIASKAVENVPLSFNFTSVELKDNLELAIAAVSANKHAFDSVSYRLSKNPFLLNIFNGSVGTPPREKRILTRAP